MKSQLLTAIATIGLILGNTNIINADSIHPIIIAKKQQNTVKFKDKNLENAIRKQLKLGISKKTPLTADKLAKITVLEITGFGTPDDERIKSLAGIEKLTNLTTLSLDSNQITDIKPLSGLSNLTYFNLGRNPITNCQILPEKLRKYCPVNK